MVLQGRNAGECKVRDVGGEAQSEGCGIKAPELSTRGELGSSPEIAPHVCPSETNVILEPVPGLMLMLMLMASILIAHLHP